ncbi:hypothetical protein K8Z61_01640 [Nocardioides sp. TRM66260-LWL]|uniref:hypothetical protein n=1 Tax=Nocardioides sp. TRM66260-LWL TaxID=2874478 RepID=UPI001CC58284|nr:hypothetical protein [Nocardioides sp. TRM66260-LWL]MBZ5733184.1 hypothetical protein [Nocardioides sp. TRM66260-LWL]
MESDQTRVMPAVPGDGGPRVGTRRRQARWWHRDHPVFTPLAGFFGGMLFVIVVPSLYAAILSALVSQDAVTSLFAFVLLALVVPIGLIAAPSTRRLGRYLALGMVSTLLVVGVVAAGVLWFLVNRQT